MDRPKTAWINLEIKLDDTRRAAKVWTTEEMHVHCPDIEKYSIREIMGELFDKKPVIFDILGEAEYLLQLKKEVNDANLITYTGRLYDADIKPGHAVERPAWWEVSNSDMPVTLPDSSVRKQHYQCTGCYNISERAYRYCPHCGAVMQGVK